MIFPGEKGVPIGPLSPRRGLFEWDERQVCHRKKPPGIGLGTPTEVAEGVELLDVAHVQAGLFGDEPPYGQLEGPV